MGSFLSCHTKTAISTVETVTVTLTSSGDISHDSQKRGMCIRLSVNDHEVELYHNDDHFDPDNHIATALCQHFAIPGLALPNYDGSIICGDVVIDYKTKKTTFKQILEALFYKLESERSKDIKLNKLVHYAIQKC